MKRILAEILVIAAVSMAFGFSAQAACPGANLTNGTTADANDVMAWLNCKAPLDGPLFTGNVGIGTTTPASRLVVENEGTDLSGLLLKLYNQNTTVGGGESQFGIYIARGAAGNGYYFESFANPSGTMYSVDSSGDGFFAGWVGVGTSAPSYPLYVNGTAYATGAAGALSDIRHKKNVLALSDGVLQGVMRLRPVSFYWKEPRDDGMQGRQIGFIAQDVEKVFPTMVLIQKNAEKAKGLKYNELIALLTKAVQEQQKEIVELKVSLHELKAERSGSKRSGRLLARN